MHDAERRRDAILEDRSRCASRSSSRSGAVSRTPSRSQSRAAPRLRDIKDVRYTVKTFHPVLLNNYITIINPK